ncbi:MAG: hypothetical protein ACLT98_09385 [Eggerthellaceae bacterium]
MKNAGFNVIGIHDKKLGHHAAAQMRSGHGAESLFDIDIDFILNNRNVA